MVMHAVIFEQLFCHGTPDQAYPDYIQCGSLRHTDMHATSPFFLSSSQSGY